MSKKGKEYKAGDFIFAKVKGYPAWPARVQRLNGKKYFVYFYGTGETANLPPNMIFDYAENKDKFLTKQQKRRDFNEGVRQIEHDFANNVPIEDVVGTAAELPADGSANKTLNDSANETMNSSAVTDTSADETLNETPANVTQTDVPIEDSDDTGALVIDEGKKGKKPVPKTPAKETPKAKEPKTPRGRGKKEEPKEDKEDEKKEAEIISRSGRKIRPKRYIDEQTEENTTLPSPAAKKRRGQTPEKEKEPPVEEKKKADKEKGDKNNKSYNAVSQSELEDLKEPIPAAVEKDNILITYLPTGTYVGIKLFQSVPASFKTENAKLQWYKQQASNALSLKLTLERGQITPQSIAAQLVTDLNLTDEEKATLDKERENEEKKSRVQFLKTEMKLIELDAKIKTCLCLEKADTESCLKLLDELMELNLKPLMLLKHPTCVETVKRMRAYVGNTPCWGLSESDALQFSKHAQSIRKHADTLYNNMKVLFSVPEGLSFWEFFSERVLLFKKATAKLNADELLEMVHEPIEMTQPTSHTMKSAIDAANEDKKDEKDTEEPTPKKRSTPAKKKKETAPANSTPSKSLKRQSSRNKQSEKEAEQPKEAETLNGSDNTVSPNKDQDKEKDKSTEKSSDLTETIPETNKETESSENQENTETQAETTEKSDKTELNDKTATQNDKTATQNDKTATQNDKAATQNDKTATQNDKETEEMEVDTDKGKDKPDKEISSQDKEKDSSDGDKSNKVSEKLNKETEKDKEAEKQDGEPEEKQKDNEKSNDKDKDADEPRAKRSRETKKTEAPPPRSPAKRKAKV